MAKRIIQIKVAIVMVMTLFMYNQCGNPYQSKPTELQFTDNSQSVSVLGSIDSVKAFEDSVWQITRSRCIACHSTQRPTHAHSDPKVAHDAVIDSYKVNFSNLASSRIVAKIRDENHGCWSDCSANSNEMLEAVQYWADKIVEIEGEYSGGDDGTGGTDGSGGYTEVPESVDVFEDTVYQLTRQRCVGCHNNTSPRHANDDVVVAHDAVEDNGLVNFDDIGLSRLVTRLSVDAHQCWNADCAASALEMEAAIEAWQAGMNIKTDPTNSSDPMTTSESDTVTNEINGSAQTATATISAGGGTITSPFVFTGGADGYLWAPTGTGNNYSAGADGVGLAEYTFNVPTAGTYKMSGVVEATPNNNDSFYIAVDGENFFDWQIPPSNTFSMQEVSSGSGGANKQWSLSAGAHTLVVKQREDGTKVKYFTVYPASQDSPNLGPEEALLSYNVSAILGINEQVTFQVKVKIFDDYSYKFWDPELITTDSNIRVKNIQLLINGYYNPQHSAYTIIDKVVTPGNSSLATHALLALKDQGESIDRISFKFEILQVID